MKKQKTLMEKLAARMEKVSGRLHKILGYAEKDPAAGLAAFVAYSPEMNDELRSVSEQMPAANLERELLEKAKKAKNDQRKNRKRQRVPKRH